MNTRFCCIGVLLWFSLLFLGCDRKKDGAGGTKKMPSPLAKAVSDEDYQLVERLLESGVSPDDTGTDAISPLGRAILKRDSRSVEMLLKAGASATNEINWRTPLGLAAGSDSVDMTVLLLRHGLNPGGTNSDGSTAMSFAAVAPTTGNLAVLLAAGAEVNVVDRFGSSPLLNAMSSRAYENALWLIDHGANVSVTNTNGMYPLQTLDGPAFDRKNFEALMKLRKRFSKQ
jgi:ankyrin repeat protein